MTLDSAIGRGLRWGIGLGFLAVSLAPGGQPRYTLPLLVPASILLALTLLTQTTPTWLPLVWSRVVTVCLVAAMMGAVAAVSIGGPGTAWRWGMAFLIFVAGCIPLERAHRGGLPALALASAVGMALLTADFALGAIRPLRRAEAVRPVGAAINHAAGPGATVAVLRPGFLPFLFYVRSLRYIQSVDSLPISVPCLLVRENDLPAASEALGRRRIGARIALHAKDKRVKDDRLNDWVLLHLEPARNPGL